MAAILSPRDSGASAPAHTGRALRARCAWPAVAAGQALGPGGHLFSAKPPGSWPLEAHRVSLGHRLNAENSSSSSSGPPAGLSRQWQGGWGRAAAGRRELYRGVPATQNSRGPGAAPKAPAGVCGARFHWWRGLCFPVALASLLRIIVRSLRPRTCSPGSADWGTWGTPAS